MREILFRGKRVDDGEWVEGWYGKKSFGAWPLRDAITPCVDAGNGYLHYEEVIPETVGQYTGLQDKNGNRIFEGDIIRYTVFLDVIEMLKLYLQKVRSGQITILLAHGCGTGQ